MAINLGSERGVDAIISDLWQTLTRDGRKLVEARDDELRKFSLWSSRWSHGAEDCPGPGVYGHFLYERGEEAMGVYVGSSYSVQARIRSHRRLVAKGEDSRRAESVDVVKTHASWANRHYDIWRRCARRGRWLIISRFRTASHVHENESATHGYGTHLALLLGLAELYAAVLSRPTSLSTRRG